MNAEFRVGVLPGRFQPVVSILEKIHALLARLRVRDGSDNETQLFDTLCDGLRSAVSPFWDIDLNAAVVEWLETEGEFNSEYRYEAWVVRSLWFLMNPNVEVSEKLDPDYGDFVLPHHLHYLEREAKDAKLGTEQEAVEYAKSATPLQRNKMFEVANTMISNGHAKEVFAFLKENSIVTHRSSRSIYWYLGAMDFAGANFD